MSVTIYGHVLICIFSALSFPDGLSPTLPQAKKRHALTFGPEEPVPSQLQSVLVLLQMQIHLHFNSSQDS